MEYVNSLIVDDEFVLMMEIVDLWMLDNVSNVFLEILKRENNFLISENEEFKV